ncbi:MAG: hypothetical protein DDT40_00683 [candidate division WS2 bacterium]|nr:hypothetical protein [Candidatus Psychracetigena formicireducens]
MLNRLLLNMLFEIKGMKIFWLQIFMSLFVMPTAFLFLALLRIGPDSEEVAFLLSGFIVASLVGSFFGALALRICNLMQIEVLELYSTFALSKGEIISNMAFTYALFALPQILISIVVLAFTSPSFNAFLMSFSILWVILLIALLAVWLGLVVRNYYYALGIFPLLAWISILLTPAYYDMAKLNPIFQMVLFINPITHCLNLLRIGLGLTPPLYFLWSLLYTSILFGLLLILTLKRIKDIYILEKLF